MAFGLTPLLPTPKKMRIFCKGSRFFVSLQTESETGEIVVPLRSPLPVILHPFGI